MVTDDGPFDLKISPHEERFALEVKELAFKSKKASGKWKKRMTSLEEDYKLKRKGLFRAHIMSFSFRSKLCSMCQQQVQHTVRCASCFETLCWKCDTIVHNAKPFHERSVILEDMELSYLGACQFLDSQGKIIVQSRCKIYEKILFLFNTNLFVFRSFNPLFYTCQLWLLQ